MATYAPINMPPPESGQEIAEQIRNSILGPLQQGSEYQSLLGQQPGLNIGPDMPKFIVGLMRALGLADPSGMVGGPAGLVYKTSASTSPQLLKMLDTIKKIGTTAEEISPRMRAITKDMPVNLLQPWQSRPGSIADYISPSPLRKLGTANLYRPDPTAVLHEAAGHGLQALDPATKELIYNLYMQSPVGTESTLTALGTPPKFLREEFGARLIENVLSKKVAEKLGMPVLSGPISFTPEMEERIWQFLQEVPSNEIKSSKTLPEVLSKTKTPSTSSKLEQLYNDIVTFTAEENPIRSKIETNPFARAKFANQLKAKISSFDDSPLKNKLMKDITNIGDLKDPKSALKLELLAQDVHLNTRMQAAKYEDLLKAEFGEEDATKIMDKLWGKVYVEEGPADLLKSEVKSPGVLRRAKDFFDRTFFEHADSPLHGQEINYQGRIGYFTGKPPQTHAGVKYEQIFFPWDDADYITIQKAAKERKAVVDPGNLGQYQWVPSDPDYGLIKTGKNILKSEQGSFSNKEIRKEMEESIGRDISKKVRGKTQPRKGGGMIVNKPDKLSDYLSEYPTKGKGWQLIRE